MLRCDQVRGFTYVGLLLAMALAGAALAGVGVLWSTHTQREREVELLFVGAQFKQAIADYYAKAPAGQRNRFPDKLDDLLLDRRWPMPRRHLRRIFVDPMTNGFEWGLVKVPGFGIVGVHSLSDALPRKRAGFPDGLGGFALAKTYRDWRFVHADVGAASTAKPQPTPQAPATPHAGDN